MFSFQNCVSFVFLGFRHLFIEYNTLGITKSSRYVQMFYTNYLEQQCSL